MKFTNPTAQIFVPDGKPVAEALQRITHLGIGAHQDDLEFMAFDGILKCYHSADKWFGGVTCTNGAGSSRTGPYAGYTDKQMMEVRKEEQRTAAIVGHYGAMIQLDFTSKAIKNHADPTLKNDLKQILAATNPEVVYTHNLADKHDTHIGVAISLINAIRELPAAERPGKLIGCEVWRNLDWLPDSEKVVMDVSAHENLAAAVNGVFDSQIAGGKRYDLATAGRRRANATFFESHGVDEATSLIFGMDLTPLIQDDTLDLVEFVAAAIQRFQKEATAKLAKQLGRA
jgi:LmbE family N-acetylglucosaminyl deacetylase